MDWLSLIPDAASLSGLFAPARLHTVAEALARETGAPRRPGIYGWYFDAIPPRIDAARCHRHDSWTLLYCGISPKKPAANGKAASKSHIRQRLGTHFGGNAAGSTLRLTLGCLLEAEIGTVLQRVGTRGRLTFTNPGEQLLDGWLHRHARVVWVEHKAPWVPEEHLLESGLPLPLNIDGNPCIEFTAPLSALRSAARRRAATLPIVADSGGPRRKGSS